jgi:hypothetical protein
VKRSRPTKPLVLSAAALPALVRSAWSEAEFTKHVIALARENGFLAAHFRPGRTRQGWRTALSGDGVGFPDLILIRAAPGAKIIAAELKCGKNKPTPAQAAWLAAFRAVGITAVVWTPSEWPVILAVLTKGREP